MSSMASQITSLTIVYSAFYSRADQRKHQSSASLPFVWGIHRRPVNSPDKRPVTRKMFPFDDIIMENRDTSFTGQVGCSWFVFHVALSTVTRGVHRITLHTPGSGWTEVCKLSCHFVWIYIRGISCWKTNEAINTIFCFRPIKAPGYSGEPLT